VGTACEEKEVMNTLMLISLVFLVLALAFGTYVTNL
jgi:hypothetical protein